MATLLSPLGIGTVIAIWSQGLLSGVLVLLRFLARRVSKTAVGWDDWLMLVALLLAWAAFATLTISVLHGLGNHRADIDPRKALVALELQWIFRIPITLAGVFGRFSITVFLGRVFSSRKWMNLMMWFLAALDVVAAVVGLTATFAQCNPTAKLWNASLPGYCISNYDQADISLWKAAIKVVSDFITALWPICVVWNLKMNIRLKIVLGMIFGLTFLAMAVTIVEMTYLPDNVAHDDETYISAQLCNWVSAAENTIIVAGSIPLLRPLFLGLHSDPRPAKITPQATYAQSGTTSRRRRRPDQWALTTQDVLPTPASDKAFVSNTNEARLNSTGSDEQTLKDAEDRAECGGMQKGSKIEVFYDST